MKLLLIGPDARIRRLLAPGGAGVVDEITVVTRRAELHGRDLNAFGVALLDWEMRPDPGETWLTRLREVAPQVAVVALVASASAGGEARRLGAVATMTKPVNVDLLRARLQEVEKRSPPPSPPSPTTAAGATGGEAEADVRFVTHSAAMESVLSIAWRVAPSMATVLLLGENGTGKTLLARAIHARSTRCARPFVTVNCPCLQSQLLESELFGHARGAFTGAVSDAPGKVAAAEGGTLFLDEAGELPLELQAKLLRLLQERRYERVGEARTRTADIRVIAATNRDLRAQVAAGLFREDLYYRLNVISIEMPPLRSRPEDILPSAEFFLESIGRTAGGRRRDLTLAARDALLAHAWPGNLRELRNAVERAAILCDREWLDASDFAELAGRGGHETPQVGEFVTLDAIIEAHIRGVASRAESYEQAARILGIDKSTLYRWRKRFETAEPGSAEPAFAG